MSPRSHNPPEFEDTPAHRPEMAARELFRFLDHLPLMAGAHGDGTVLHANPALGEFLGAEPADIAGRRLEEFVHPEDRQALERALADSRAREAGGTELSVRLREGPGVALQLLICPVLVGEDGEVQLLFLLDATRHRRTREDRDRLVAILETIPDLVGTADVSGRVLFLNRSGRRLLGYGTDEDLRGLSISIFHPEWAKEILFDTGIPTALETGLWWGESAFVTKAGEEIPVSQVILAHRSADGDVAYLSTIGRDIRDQKSIQQALRRSEEKFETVFRIAPFAAAITTRGEGRVVEVNDAGLKLFGYTREEAVGRTTAELGIWPEFAERDALVERALREPGMELPMRTRAGETRDMLLYMRPMSLDGRPHLLSIAHDISDRKLVERKLEELALYDSLTGLPNRNLFEDRLAHALERAARKQSRVAVLFLDLDRFKVVNDTLGHATGDRLLAAFAHRLKGCLRKEDTVARFGGDEFACLFEDVTDASEAEAAAARLRKALETPIEVRGTRVHVTASMGIALSSLDLRRPEDLLRFSDVAMYRAKQVEGTTVHVFDARSDTLETERLHRENELRAAVERGEFVVHYQPVVRLADRRTVGAEALVRWAHPERGLLPPGDFIDLAEDMGLIVALGDRVLAEAAAACARWRRLAGYQHFRMSVNLSPRQFQRPELPGRLHSVLAEHGLAPDGLQLEITESVMMRGPERTADLRKLGVRLVIDDFGTGYSSLQYVKYLEVDGLKVDRTFVAGLSTDPRDEAILRAVALIGERLGIDLVAEGIEKEEQAERLRAIGYTLGQGFLYAPPMEAERMEARLRAAPPASPISPD